MKRYRIPKMIVRLQKNLNKALAQGNPWIYQNAISESSAPKVTSLCTVVDSKGKPLGTGIYCPQSPLRVRMLSSKSGKSFDLALHTQTHLQLACQLRSQLFRNSKTATTGYRLVNGEGDHLPGVVVDRYSDHLVVQFDGKELHEFWSKTNLLESLVRLDQAQILVKSRDKTEQARAQIDSQLVRFQENGVIFEADLQRGQKTGFFFDQRDNRQFIQSLANQLNVLNLFSYTGGFSVCAGLGGAKSVTSVDISAEALELAQRNWELNKLKKDSHRALKLDLIEAAKGVGTSQFTGHPFDLVICDPPALCTSEKTKPAALQIYKGLIAMSLKACKPDGLLAVSSCSSHISFEDLQTACDEVFSSERAKAQILRISGQGADHPYRHAHPELRYLKFFLFRLYS